jgi:hypothetical protein
MMLWRQLCTRTPSQVKEIVNRAVERYTSEVRTFKKIYILSNWTYIGEVKNHAKPL